MQFVNTYMMERERERERDSDEGILQIGLYQGLVLCPSCVQSGHTRFVQKVSGLEL
jgi:hypothetical protein